MTSVRSFIFACVAVIFVLDNIQLCLAIKDIIGEPVSEDAYLTTPELITKYGYPTETHYVQTSDNYVLTVHRIPSTSSQDNKKLPIFLQHGLLADSASYVFLGPQLSLAYILADAGYDVWMGNARGNTYSKNNTKISPNSREFWQFSWHEIGKYDLPAMIDYVLDQTAPGNDSAQLYYIGHSQGTTSFYVMASEVPEYNKKIKLMISLSPVAFMSHLKSPLVRILSPGSVLLKDPLNLVGGFEIFQDNSLATALDEHVCAITATNKLVCTNVFFLLFGFDSAQLNSTTLPVILGHVPAGASTLQLLHYGQLTQSGKFRQYDKGLMNMATYKQLTPPDYNLNNIEAPVALFYSGNDWLSAIEDVDILSGKLPNVVFKEKVADEKFNHVDYITAINAPVVLFPRIMYLLGQY